MCAHPLKGVSLKRGPKHKPTSLSFFPGGSRSTSYRDFCGNTDSVLPEGARVSCATHDAAAGAGSSMVCCMSMESPPNHCTSKRAVTDVVKLFVRTVTSARCKPCFGKGQVTKHSRSSGPSVRCTRGTCDSPAGAELAAGQGPHQHASVTA